MKGSKAEKFGIAATSATTLRSLRVLKIGLLAALIPILACIQTWAQEASAAGAGPPALRDGQHDFDFEIGTWKTQLRLRLHPLSGSDTWVEFSGTSVVHRIWGGRANMVVLEADSPSGHIEALNLRLYNPESRQWSLNFANSKTGTLGVPTIGEFHDGRGEFYDMEPINGRNVLVRQILTHVNAESCRFEQAFSEDGGRTWEVNWIATDTRVKDPSDKAQ